MKLCTTCGRRWEIGGPRCPEDGTLLVLADAPVASAPRSPSATWSAGQPALAAPRPAAPGELAPGDCVGEYVIERRIGAGGMGVVYGARHPVIGKRAAIKILGARLTADEEAVSRFVLEAQAVNRIGHANIVDIFSFGTLDDGRSYFAMEWLAGETLGQRLERGRLAVRDAAAILSPLCRALEAAHAAGVIHRDLKPDNVFLVTDDDGWRVKLLDFGIAKLSSDSASVSRTATGVAMGTPLYMAPEQARGEAVDGRTDVYALGLLAYTMVCGASLFEDEGSAIEILAAHINKPPVPPRARVPSLPAALDALILEMIAKDPAERPALVDIRRRFAAIAEAAPPVAAAAATLPVGITALPASRPPDMPDAPQAPPASRPPDMPGAPQAPPASRRADTPRPLQAPPASRPLDVPGAPQDAAPAGPPTAIGAAGPTSRPPTLPGAPPTAAGPTSGPPTLPGAPPAAAGPASRPPALPGADELPGGRPATASAAGELLPGSSAAPLAGDARRSGAEIVPRRPRWPLGLAALVAVGVALAVIAVRGKPAPVAAGTADVRADRSAGAPEARPATTASPAATAPPPSAATTASTGATAAVAADPAAPAPTTDPAAPTTDPAAPAPTTSAPVEPPARAPTAPAPPPNAATTSAPVVPRTGARTAPAEIMAELAVEPRGAQLSVDDQPVTLVGGRARLALSPGDHDAVASAGGRVVRQRFTVTPDRTARVTLRVPAAAPSAAAQPPTAPHVDVDGVEDPFRK